MGRTAAMVMKNRKDANYPDPFNGIKVMVEFQRPSIEEMIVNVTYMNQKATALTDFNSIPVVPSYVEVEATGFASNFLPGNNQGFLQQRITMNNTAMAQGKPFKLQMRIQWTKGGAAGQVSFEVPALSSPANTFAGAGGGANTKSSSSKWAVDL